MQPTNHALHRDVCASTSSSTRYGIGTGMADQDRVCMHYRRMYRNDKSRVGGREGGRENGTDGDPRHGTARDGKALMSMAELMLMADG